MAFIDRSKLDLEGLYDVIVDGLLIDGAHHKQGALLEALEYLFEDGGAMKARLARESIYLSYEDVPENEENDYYCLGDD